MKRLYIILIIAAALVVAIFLFGLLYSWKAYDNLIKTVLKEYHPMQYKFEKEFYESFEPEKKQRLKKFWNSLERKGWKRRTVTNPDQSETFEWFRDGSRKTPPIVVDPQLWNNKIQEREELITKYLPPPDDEKKFLKQYHKQIANDDQRIASLFGLEPGSMMDRRLALQTTWAYFPPVDGYFYGGQWKHKETEEVVNVKPDDTVQRHVRPLKEYTIPYNLNERL